MKTQRNHYLKAPVEAYNGKHINFLAEENVDIDPGNKQPGEDGIDNDDDLEEQENNINEDEDAVINDPTGSTNVGNTLLQTGKDQSN